MFNEQSLIESAQAWLDATDKGNQKAVIKFNPALRQFFMAHNDLSNITGDVVVFTWASFVNSDTNADVEEIADHVITNCVQQNLFPKKGV